MKKSLIYIIAGLTLTASVGFTAAISSFATTEQSDDTKTLETRTDLGTSALINSLSKSESVFVITNPDGSLNKSFVGNTINDSTAPLPLDAKITYRLDGSEISATELAGKSGRVQITYDFTATKYYQNKLVPFLTVTSLTLDNAKFKNIKIDHGKIISETSDNVILAGYTLAGLNEDLDTDILPSRFTVTADVTNFALDTTYTFATNELFADLDTTKLTSIDSLINSVNDLAAGLDRIISGANDLAKGSNDLAAGAQKLAAGAADLSQGADQLAAGSQKLSAGLDELTSHNAELSAGATAIITSTLENLASEGLIVTTDDYAEILTATIDNLTEILKTLPEGSAQYNVIKAKIASLTQVKGLLDLSTGIIGYADGVATAAAGATELSDGATALATGAHTLKDGAAELSSGATKLSAGTHTLKDGLTTFKSQGINKLVDFANRDLSRFTANVRTTVSAADSYHYYKNPAARSVKFLFKTPAIK